MNSVLSAIGLLSDQASKLQSQCIRGASGDPLIAGRVVPPYASSNSGYRSAVTPCGQALHGSVQALVKALSAQSPNPEKVIHLDPEIFHNKDVTGAIKSIMGSDYKLTSTDRELPREGNVHLQIPRLGDNITVSYLPSPTITEDGVKQGLQPEAKVVPTNTVIEATQKTLMSGGSFLAGLQGGKKQRKPKSKKRKTKGKRSKKRQRTKKSIERRA